MAAQHTTIQVTAQVTRDVTVDSKTPAKEAIREAMEKFTHGMQAKEVEFYDFNCSYWHNM